MKGPDESASSLQDSENGNAKLVLKVNELESDGASSIRENEERRPLQDEAVISLDHIVKTSIELDEVAMKKIELLLAIGSRRLAQDFKELLEEAFRAVDQNANLLRILRHKMGTSKDE